MIPIQELGYRDYYENILSRIPGGRFPAEGTLELTYRCVLRCKHCYTACNQYADQEMTAPEWCRLLDEAAELGTLELLITGGDPMLKGELFRQVYTHAKKKGMWVTIFTSGNLINEKWAQFFAQDPPFLIEVTLYGATEATYEELTQIKGSYKRCMEGFDWMEKYGIPFKLKTVFMDINKNDFHACKKIAKSRGQEAFRWDAALHPKLDGSNSPLAHRLTPKEVVEMDLNDPERAQAMRKQFLGPLKLRSPEEIKNFHCGAGKVNFYSNPYGKIQVCTLVPGKEYEYDWRGGGTLQEAFYDFFPTISNSKPKSPQRCHQCYLWEVCNMCAGMSAMTHGDLETPVDWLCELTHRRAIALGTDPKLFSHSMMYQKIMEGKTFPETKVSDEGFHGNGPVALPTFSPPIQTNPAPQKSACCGGGGCAK